MEQTQSMTVAVTGATGFVGRHVVRHLADQGYEVRGLARDHRKAAATLPPSGVRTVVGDVFDRAVLSDLMQGAEAVVHAIGIRREFPRDGVTFDRLHRQATEMVIEAAIQAGVGRFILVSALGVRHDAPTAYYRTKYEAEKALRRSGLAWSIVRPSIIHGPDGELVQMIKDWVLGRAAPRLFIPYFARVEIGKGFPPKPPRLVSAQIEPVFVDDVAEAIGACLTRTEAVGEVYPLTGAQRLDWPTMLSAVRDAMPLTDRRKRIIPIPFMLGVGAARIARAIGLAAALPFGEDEPMMASEDSIATRDKVRSNLGMETQPFSTSLHAYAHQI